MRLSPIGLGIGRPFQNNMLVDIATHGLFTEGIHAGSIVVDLGANIGAFARAMVDLFGCEVIAVEPSAQYVKQLSTMKGLRTMRAAACDRDGWVDFHVNRNSQMSSIVPLGGGNYESVERVEAVTWPRLLARCGLDHVDVLKVDIEGGEVSLLAGMTDSMLADIAQLTIELHDFNGMISGAAADRIEGRLIRLGFHRIQLSRTSRENVLFFQPQRCGITPATESWARLVTRNLIGLRRMRARSCRRISTRAHCDNNASALES